MREESGHPRARTSELVVKTVGEEVLVYDLTRNKAHSLNPQAAAVWRACDGTRGVAALGVIAGEPGRALPDEAVRYALQILGRAQLLDQAAEQRGLTRRQVMARLGTAAAVALPLVTTVVAPTAAQAISCKSLGQTCTTTAECCGQGCDSTTSGCLCNLFKTLGLRCLQITPPEG